MGHEETPANHWGTISIDEMSPEYSGQFSDIVTLTTEHFSKSMHVGDKLRASSNKEPGLEVEGTVTEIDLEKNKIKVQLDLLSGLEK